jgi:hypothetical protein
MHATHAGKQIVPGMHRLLQGFICRTSENDMVFNLNLISSAILALIKQTNKQTFKVWQLLGRNDQTHHRMEPKQMAL